MKKQIQPMSIGKYVMKAIGSSLFLLFPLGMTVQTSSNDSISRTVALDEVTIVASNVTRVDNHLVIYPNTQQKKSSNSGYGVLKRLMIPGMIVDTQSNKAEAMGMPVSFYINGQPADERDVRMLRPKDIAKIEYHDNSTGKYAKDQIVVNFILKEYKAGGYVQLDGLQTIGYTHGDYNLATTLNRKHTTYSVFAGANYFDVSNNRTGMVEHYALPGQPVDRTSGSDEAYSKHSEYVQFRLQRQKAGRYIVGKLSLINNASPRSEVAGTVRTGDEVSAFTTSTD